MKTGGFIFRVFYLLLHHYFEKGKFQNLSAAASKIATAVKTSVNAECSVAQPA